MGNQKTVIIGEEAPEIGEPIADHNKKKKEHPEKKQEKAKEIKAEKIEKAKDEDSKEVEATTESSDKKEEKAESPEKKKKEKVGKAKVRSKKYKEAIGLIDRTKKYDLTETIELVKKTTLTKFDGNVEVHVRLLSKTGKPENLRGFLKYPHATGKTSKVVILDEAMAEEILKTKKIDFDIALATPEMMPKIAKLAKILGPKGKMPNPKAGTISADPEKVKKELEGGQVEYKTDSYGSIHQIIGKVSAEPKTLAENFESLLAILPKDKIDSVTLCATMGPGIKVQL